MSFHNPTQRSFNTFKHSNREQRAKRHRRERTTLLSIFTVVILIILTLIIFLVASFVDVVTPSPNRPQGGTTGSADTNNDAPAKPQQVYTPITWDSAKINDGVLVIVNQDHAIEPKVSDLVNIYANRTKVNGENPYQVAFDTYRMQREAFLKMEAMMLQFYEISDGDRSTLISSAFRTLQEQTDLGSVVEAGHSDHHTGYCVALKSANSSALDLWFYENCHKYGFVQRYPAGKEDVTGVSDYEHCFRYVGMAHAAYMTAHNLCMEEYVELLKNNHPDSNPLTVTDANGTEYQIYYVPAAKTELTTIQIPKDASYQISGDNIGGFIVTVTLDT